MFVCTSCHATALKWSGQCPNCGVWNTLEKAQTGDLRNMRGGQSIGKKKTISPLQPKAHDNQRIHVRSHELATVLGGGIVPGSLILLSGEPGIGKSTLTLQMANWVATSEKNVLYVSGEEGEAQIADRAHRLGVNNDAMYFLHEHRLEDILTTLDAQNFPLVIVDSISVLYSQGQGGAIGGTTQIRTIAEALMEYAKRTNTAMIMIGHVTKDGELAGPKTLEHLVDTVLYLEGNRYEEYRLLRTMKNRFGPTNEVGVFKMTETGLLDVINPGIEFLSESAHIGSALSVTMEGSRPIIVEIEALVTPSRFGYPKRSVQGLPSGKIDQLVAVISRFGHIPIDQDDVYVNVSRGFRIQEPAVDLAIVAALISSKKSYNLGKQIFVGEVALNGIIRSPMHMTRRMEMAKKLGCTLSLLQGTDIAEFIRHLQSDRGPREHANDNDTSYEGNVSREKKYNT